jgi:TonB family protein
MQSIAIAPQAHLPPAPAAGSTVHTPSVALLATPDLTAPSQPNGQAQAPANPLLPWLDQVKSLLEQHKQYPSSALRRQQQDTVMLNFSVDRNGRVTQLRIDSSRHYRALEKEVRRMVQLTGRLPAPPAQVDVAQYSFTVPITFNLTKPAASRETLARCAAPQSPGPAPTGATATPQQMSAYRQRLNEFLLASRTQLACISKVPGADALASRKALTQQLQGLVANFNTQVGSFQSALQAKAQSAQASAAAKQTKARMLAQQAYASCEPPASPVGNLPSPTMSASNAFVALQAYRKQLLRYRVAVGIYLACLKKADKAVLLSENIQLTGAPGRELLSQDAATLADTAIGPLNDAISSFNARLRRQKMQVLVQAPAIFPDSVWQAPEPLPKGECIRVFRFGKGYRAELCQTTYLSSAILNEGRGGSQSGMSSTDAAIASATVAEQIAASHGIQVPDLPDQPSPPPVLGIAVAPTAASAQQNSSQPPSVTFTVGDLRVTGRHLFVAITRSSDKLAECASGETSGDVSEPSDTNGPEPVTCTQQQPWHAMLMELALSQDSQSLRGQCSTEQRHWACTLTRGGR